jgi:hypothetical protein
MTFLGMSSTILTKTRSKLNMDYSSSLVNIWKRTRPVPRVCAYCIYTVACSMNSLKRERLVTVVWNTSGPVNDSETVVCNNFFPLNSPETVACYTPGPFKSTESVACNTLGPVNSPDTVACYTPGPFKSTETVTCNNLGPVNILNEYNNIHMHIR